MGQILDMANGQEGEIQYLFNQISPLTTAGDTLYLNSGLDHTRLAIGTNNYIYIARSGLPSWQQFLVSGQVASGAIMGNAGGGYFNIASGSLNGFELGSGAIVSGRVASGAIGFGHLANASVQSGTYASGSISRFAVASGSFLGFELGSGAIVSGRVASGTIGFGHLADGSVQSGTVISGSIAHPHIASGAIASGQLATTGTPTGSLFLRDDFAWTAPSSNQTVCHVYNSANISITDSTDTRLTFDTERTDTDAFHSTTVNTGRITIPTGQAGHYMFGANILWTAANTGLRRMWILLNGLTIIASTEDLSLGNNGQALTGHYNLSEADYIEVFVRQSSGGAINVTNNANYSPEFWAVKVGGASSTTVATALAGNKLINGGFDFFQRQTPGTLTTIAVDSYGPDRWRSTRQNASLQVQRVTGGTETGITAAWYATYKQITNTGKFHVCQIVESRDIQDLRSRTVIFQAQMKGSASQTVRMAIIELQAAGTADTIPGTLITAWGADTVDPTLGANLAIITGAQSKSVTTSWQNFSVSVVVPSNSLNLLCAIWTDSGVVANTTLSIAEAGLYDGAVTQPWLPRLTEVELAMAQRFYEKSWSVDIAPLTGSSPGSWISSTGTNSLVATTAYSSVKYKVTKRAAPTTTVSPYTTPSNTNRVSRFSDGVDLGASSSATAAGYSSAGVLTTYCNATVTTDSLGVAFHWQAAAEL